MHVASFLVFLTVASTTAGLAPLYRSEDPLPNRYMIKLKPTSGTSTRSFIHELLSQSDQLVKEGNGFGHVNYIDAMDSKYLQLIALELDYKSLDMVRQNPSVEYIEEEEREMIVDASFFRRDVHPDHTDTEDSDLMEIDPETIDTKRIEQLVMKRFPYTELSMNQAGFYGLDRINQRNNTQDENKSFKGDGFGVNVYVVSSGIRRLHREFDCRARYGYDSLETDGEDCNSGHGTSVASLAVGRNTGVAKQAQLHSVKVHNCETTVSPVNHVKGMQWVADNFKPPCVVLLTLIAKGKKYIDDAAESLVDAGCVVIANSGSIYGDKACQYSPARSPKVITVSATNVKDRKLPWSNYGMCVDIFAPGLALLSADNTDDDSYQMTNGPDLPAAFVAGVAAVHLGNGVPATDMRERILGDATPCVVEQEGGGTPNRLLYVEAGPQTDSAKE